MKNTGTKTSIAIFGIKGWQDMLASENTQRMQLLVTDKLVNKNIIAFFKGFYLYNKK